MTNERPPIQGRGREGKLTISDQIIGDVSSQGLSRGPVTRAGAQEEEYHWGLSQHQAGWLTLGQWSCVTLGLSLNQGGGNVNIRALLSYVLPYFKPLTPAWVSGGCIKGNNSIRVIPFLKMSHIQGI